MPVGSMTVLSEASLRSAIRAELPPQAFARRPLRILLAVPLIALIAGTSALLLAPALPWYGTLLGWLVLANAYPALMWFGHEVAHGATVRGERLQDALLWASCAIFVVSSHLWRHWHNRLHHGHTNIPTIDPDRYDLVEDLAKTPRLARWFTTRIAPGSGHWLSALYLLVAFTVHGQAVLWYYSRRQPFGGFRWTRALGETAAVAAFWLALGLWVGPGGALVIIVVPMLLSNAVVMAYITTNHMLRPLTDAPECLATTTSVTTLRAIDVAHLHFSHHVEHHLFPAMSHRYYPLVRRSLRRHAGARYLAPAHWCALLTLYRTPRHYATYDELINPLTGERLPLAEVEARLRRADPGAEDTR
jgi:fatty acid desaturase